MYNQCQTTPNNVLVSLISPSDSASGAAGRFGLPCGPDPTYPMLLLDISMRSCDNILVFMGLALLFNLDASWRFRLGCDSEYNVVDKTFQLIPEGAELDWIRGAEDLRQAGGTTESKWMI